MKRVSRWSLAAIGLLFGLAASAQEIPAFAPTAPTSYAQVAAYLNPGGDTYVYQNTAQWGETLEALLPPVRDLLVGISPAHDREEMTVLCQLIEAFLKDSGLRALNGVGASSITIGDGLHHNRVYLGQTGEAKGLFWDALVQDNTDLPLLQALPPDTVLAARIPLRAGLVWQWLRKTVAAVGNPELQADIERELGRHRQAGIDLDTWLSSQGDGLGIVLTLSPRPEGAPVPTDGPEAVLMDVVGRGSLAILVEVKDDTIFNALEAMVAKQNAPMQRQDVGAMRVLATQGPLPVPGQGPLAIARFGNTLAFVSNDRILKALSEGKGGLTETAEFKRLAAKMPQRGMGFSFLSPRLGDELAAVMEQVEQTGGNRTSFAPLFLSAASRLKGQASYTVSVRTKDGVLAMNTATFGLGEALVGNTFANPAMVLGPLMGVRREVQVAGNGDMAGAPSANTQVAGTIRNLNQISAALRIYASDSANRLPDDLGQLVEKEYLKAGEVFVIPGSGTKPPATAAEIRRGQCDFLYFGKGRIFREPDLPVICSKPGLIPNGRMVVSYASGRKDLCPAMPPEVKALIAAAQAEGVLVNKQDANYAGVRGQKLGSYLAQAMPQTRVLLLLPPAPEGSPEAALAAGLKAGLSDQVSLVDTVTLAPPKDAPKDAPWFTGKQINEQTAKYQDKVDLVVTGLGLPETGIQELWFWSKGVKVALAAGDVARLKKALLAKLVVAAVAVDPDVVPDEWPPPQDLDTAFAKRFLLLTPENAEALGSKHPKLFAP